MAVRTFPSLVGMAYPVNRSPVLTASRSEAWSGRRTALPRWTLPLYEFTIDVNVIWAAIDWPIFEAWWKRVALSPGQFFQFLFIEDYLAAAQSFGTGDGATTAFQLTRTVGGFSEDVLAPRIGLLAYPQDMTNVAWTLTNATLSTTATTAPDGSSTWFHLKESSATGAHYVSESTSTLLDWEIYTASCYLAAAERTWAYVSAIGKDGVENRVFVNLSTGAIGSTSGLPINATVTKATGGYRLAFSFNSKSGATTPSFRVAPSTANGTTSYAGTTGDGILSWGPQVEAGQFPLALNGPASPYPTGPMIYYNGSLTSSWTMNATGLVTFSGAPTTGHALTWSGNFNWLCQLDEDTADMDNIMHGYWALNKLKFRTARA